MVDLIIVSYNTRELTNQCITSLYNSYNKTKYSITVLDNNSNDDTISSIRKVHPNVKIIANDKNVGFAGAVNMGMANSQSEWVIIANSDLIFLDNTIDELSNSVELTKNIAVVGAQQEHIDHTLQASMRFVPSIKSALRELLFIDSIKNVFRRLSWKPRVRRQVLLGRMQYIDGALMMINRKIFFALDGFDESYFFYSEEADFCYRASTSGYVNVINSDCRVIHLRGGSSKRGSFEQRKKFIKMQMDSKMKFINKHFPRSHQSAYVIFKLAHYLLLFLLAWMNNIFRLTIFNSSKKRNVRAYKYNIEILFAWLIKRKNRIGHC